MLKTDAHFDCTAVRCIGGYQAVTRLIHDDRAVLTVFGAQALPRDEAQLSAYAERNRITWFVGVFQGKWPLGPSVSFTSQINSKLARLPENADCLDLIDSGLLNSVELQAIYLYFTDTPAWEYPLNAWLASREADCRGGAR